MDGPLVDTSVLVDYFGGRATREAGVLDFLLEHGPPPATAPLIVQEFLQGFLKSTDVRTARDYLLRFRQLPPPGYELHEKAAALHVALRRRGTTSSTVDALIVTMAAHAGCPLLSSDRIQRELAHEARVPLA